MIHHIKGDLLKSDCTVLAHQANCQKNFGAGIAAQIKKIYPKAYEADVNYPYSPKERYGKCSVAFIEEESRFIINLYAQRYPGRPFDEKDEKSRYDALESSIEKLMQSLPKLKNKGFQVKIGLPYLIGCGLAGGNWDIVYPLLEKISTKYNEDIYLYELLTK